MVLEDIVSVSNMFPYLDKLNTMNTLIAVVMAALFRGRALKLWPICVYEMNEASGKTKCSPS